MDPVIRTLTRSRWKDLETLFGRNGACGGCWCMYWRLPRPEWKARTGEENRRAFRRLVETGRRPPGLLAYLGGEAVGWIAVEPKSAYPRLRVSRRVVQVDDRPCWSVTCLFVARAHRGQGVAAALVDAAVRHAEKHGADLIEAYPVEAGGPMTDDAVYTGVPSLFRKVGFDEVARGQGRHRVMRRES